MTPRGLRHTLRMRAGTDQDPKSNAPDRHADPRGGGGGGRGHAELSEPIDLSTGIAIVIRLHNVALKSNVPCVDFLL